jgi:hypothetical protein
MEAQNRILEIMEAQNAAGSDVALGSKTDSKSSATDTTSVSAISILKEISYLLQTNIIAMSKKYAASTSFTRPNDTTAYAVGDVVGTNAATNIEFTNMGVIGEDIFITVAKLRIDVAAIPSGMGSFRLHLFNVAPTAIADNAAFNLIAADRSKYIGYIDLDTTVDLGDTLFNFISNINIQATLVSTSLFGVLETRAVYTPTSQAVKTVTLKAVGA